ncbi:MAG: hypothetical protein R3E02_00805 [Blastomonas sp.]
MSNSHRGERSKIGLKRWLWPAIVFTVTTLAFGGIQHRIHYQDAARNAAAYSRDAKNEIAAECTVPVPYNDCAREIEQTRRENQRDEYDLYAQKAMALWTAIMGAMAVVGIALSGVGVYLIWRTWDATREAAENSRKTFNAYVMRERAVLRFTENIFTEQAWNEPHKQQFFIKVKNEGMGHAQVKSVFYAVQLDAEWPLVFSPGLNTEHFVGSDAAKDWKLGRMTFVAPNDRAFFVLGYVEYFSVGESPFRSHFCYLCNPNAVSDVKVETFAGENGGAKLDHGGGGEVLLRAA